MLNKYFKIYELLQDILKIVSFAETDICIPMISTYKLVGMRRRDGYLIGVYNPNNSMNIFSIQTIDSNSDNDYKSGTINLRTETAGINNIKNCNVLDVYTDINFSIPLSDNIDLSTGLGSDELFQLSVIHSNAITDFWAICSHYKNHGISNLYYLSWVSNISEEVLGMMVLKLTKIKEDIQ